jgi:hypothetical protein
LSWTGILQKRMSTNAIGLIEYVLTSEPQSINEILEAMFDKVDEYVDSIRGTNRVFTTSNKHHIPTRNELTYWLYKQPHIKSARFDKWTNKVVTRKRPNTHVKYWRP